MHNKLTADIVSKKSKSPTSVTENWALSLKIFKLARLLRRDRYINDIDN